MKISVRDEIIICDSFCKMVGALFSFILQDRSSLMLGHVVMFSQIVIEYLRWI